MHFLQHISPELGVLLIVIFIVGCVLVVSGFFDYWIALVLRRLKRRRTRRRKMYKV